MATLTLTIPDAQAARVRDAICNRFGYSATIPDPNDPTATIPNPQTKMQFVQAHLATYLKDQVRAYEADVAARSVANDINIT